MTLPATGCISCSLAAFPAIRPDLRLVGRTNVCPAGSRIRQLREDEGAKQALYEIHPTGKPWILYAWLTAGWVVPEVQTTANQLESYLEER